LFGQKGGNIHHPNAYKHIMSVYFISNKWKW